jgi:hypothetical protein
MRWRTYTVLMPDDIEAPPAFLDIPVEGPVGIVSGSGFIPVPVPAGTPGFFVEWRNRPVRVPQHALLPNSVANPAFVPFLRLGFILSIVKLNAVAGIPIAVLSQSLVGNVFAAAGGTTPGDETPPGPGFPDPAGKPTIRLINDVDTLTGLYRVHWGICEAKDEDRSDTGSI